MATPKARCDLAGNNAERTPPKIGKGTSTPERRVATDQLEAGPIPDIRGVLPY